CCCWRRVREGYWRRWAAAGGCLRYPRVDRPAAERARRPGRAASRSERDRSASSCRPRPYQPCPNAPPPRGAAGRAYYSSDAGGIELDCCAGCAEEEELTTEDTENTEKTEESKREVWSASLLLSLVFVFSLCALCPLW